MRILHISTSTIGGAGVVASRIVEMQLKDGHEAMLLTLNPAGFRESITVKRSLFRITAARLNTIFTLFDTDPKWTQLTSSSVGAAILRKLEKLQPEIVHLHNWFNVLSLTEIEKILNKYPTIFHIHDARLMTGGCHFTLDCKLHLAKCSNCPATHTKKYFVKKSFVHATKIFEKVRPYGTIFPSKWLEASFEMSAIHRNASVKINSINPIDLELIQSITIDKSSAVLCVISDLNARVKGFDMFLEAVEKVSYQKTLNVEVIGGNPTPKQIQKMTDLEIHYLGRLPNEETLRKIGNANLLVVPSFSENSPTVIIEAQLLGTPVLGTAIPGNLELLVDRQNGFVCTATVDSLAEGITLALEYPDREEIAAYAREVALEKVSKIRFNIYQTYKEVSVKHLEAKVD
jgi:glycosyltransferase involved in cell wall biosynthesis